MATTLIARRQPHWNHGHRPADRRHRRKASLCQRSNVFYATIVVFFVFIIALFTHMLNTMPNDPLKDGSWEVRQPAGRRPPPGSAVRFRPADLMRRLEEKGRRLGRLRSEVGVGVRPQRLALGRHSIVE